jgi:hypothetical protein
MKSIDEQMLELMEPVPFQELLENSKRIVNTPYGLQDGNGVDVTLIREALRLTPEQRVERASKFAQGMINDRAQVRGKRID